MDLTYFLKQNAVPMEKIECVVSDRFLDKDKKPIKWVIAPINARYDEELKRQCMTACCRSSSQGIYSFPKTIRSPSAAIYAPVPDSVTVSLSRAFRRKG